MANPSDYTGTIADLMIRQGDIQAQRARIPGKGRIIATSLAGLANLIPQVTQLRQQEAAQRQEAADRVEQSKLRGLQMQVTEGNLTDQQDARARRSKVESVLSGPGTPFQKMQTIAAFDPETAGALGKQNADEVEKALLQWNANNGSMVRRRIALHAGPEAAQDLPETYDPAYVRQALMDKKAFLEQTAPPKVEPPKTREIKTVENGKEVTKIVPDVAGGTYEVPPPPGMTPDQIADNARADKQLGISQGQLDLARMRELREAANAGKPAKTRPVTSGDANRISDLNVALKDLDTLKETISSPGVKDATGASAQIGAAMPAMVTSITGWGVDAKKKQALIDLVKQVIGKSLEGGVLRKEDEVKYEKILPTIKDAPPIVTSKLAGLKRTIEQKRGELLSALDDAGYDTGAFTARISGQTAPAPSAAQPIRVGPYTMTVEP